MRIGRDGVLDAAWRAAAHPRLVGASLMTAGLVGLAAPAPSSVVAGVVRGLAVLSVGLTLALAVRVGLERGLRDGRLRAALSAAGLLASSSVPFFGEELAPAARARIASASPASPRPVVAVLLAVALVGSWLAVRSEVATEWGAAQVIGGDETEFWRLIRPGEGMARNIGARVGLGDRAVLRADPALPTLRVRNVDGAGAAELLMEPALATDVAGARWTAVALAPTTVAGGATVIATPRAGGPPLELSLRVGVPVTLPDQSVVELLEGHPSYGGQLGPAVHLGLRTDTQSTDQWVFGRAPGFDAAHGTWPWSFDVTAVAMNHAVQLRVADGPMAAPWFVPAAGGVLALLLTLMMLGSWRSLGIAGRDGDYRVEQTGVGPTKATAAVDRVASELLSDAQRAEIAGLARAAEAQP